MSLEPNHALGFYTLIATQCCGLLCLIAFRLSDGSRFHGLLRTLFVTAFIAVGAITVDAVATASPLWWTSAAMLGLMSIGSIVEIGPTRHTAHI